MVFLLRLDEPILTSIASSLLLNALLGDTSKLDALMKIGILDLSLGLQIIVLVRLRFHLSHIFRGLALVIIRFEEVKSLFHGQAVELTLIAHHAVY